MKYLYYCSTCNAVKSNYEKEAVVYCPKCERKMLPLLVSSDEWNKLTTDEMYKLIEGAENNRLQISNNIHDTAYSVADGRNNPIEMDNGGIDTSEK